MLKKMEVSINEMIKKNNKTYIVSNTEIFGSLEDKSLATTSLRPINNSFERRTYKGMERIYLGLILAGETITRTARIPCQLKGDNEKMFLQSFSVTGTNPNVILSINDIIYVEIENKDGDKDYLYPVMEFQIDITNMSSSAKTIPNFIVSLEATTAVTFL